jgi:hypothetical protein
LWSSDLQPEDQNFSDFVLALVLGSHSEEEQLRIIPQYMMMMTTTINRKKIIQLFISVLANRYTYIRQAVKIHTEQKIIKKLLRKEAQQHSTNTPYSYLSTLQTHSTTK